MGDSCNAMAMPDMNCRNGALSLVKLAEQMGAAGREVSSGTLSNTLQTMKSAAR
jgi:hypothetical protein